MKQKKKPSVVQLLQMFLNIMFPLNEELEEAFRNGREGQFYFARDYISNLKLSI